MIMSANESLKVRYLTWYYSQLETQISFSVAGNVAVAFMLSL